MTFTTFFRKAYEITWTVTFFTGLLLSFALFLKVLVEPMSPILTILLVILLTASTFERRTTTFMALLGITLYAVSWTLVGLGTWISMSMWGVGVLLWITAVFRPFEIFRDTSNPLTPTLLVV